MKYVTKYQVTKYNYLLGSDGKITYVSKQPHYMLLLNSCYYILNFKENFFNNFSKILKNIYMTVHSK